MFHHSNFGRFGEALRDTFSDLHGQVPEAGDQYDQFDFAAGDGLDDPDAWKEFVAAAIAATAEATEKIEAWRAETS